MIEVVLDRFTNFSSIFPNAPQSCVLRDDTGNEKEYSLDQVKSWLNQGILWIRNLHHIFFWGTDMLIPEPSWNKNGNMNFVRRIYI